MIKQLWTHFVLWVRYLHTVYELSIRDDATLRDIGFDDLTGEAIRARARKAVLGKMWPSDEKRHEIEACDIDEAEICHA